MELNTGKKPHTQTLIVSSQILDDDGKMIDPESNAKENQDIFVITVYFSNLQKDGTAEVSYQTSDFVHDARDSTERAHTVLTTQKLQMKEGKDGLVLFSNKKADVVTENIPEQKNAWTAVILIFIFLSTGVLLYRRKRSEMEG